MSRVLIVSRNPAMAMGLSATDYEVVDLRPQSFGTWIDGAEDVDALILDLESPALALAAVTNLRAHGKLAPVLLVSSDRPGWDASEMSDLPAAEVLPLPISRPVLLSALEDLLSSVWATESPSTPSTFLPPAEAGVEQGAEFTTAQALSELRQDPDAAFGFEDDLDSRITAVSTVTAPVEATMPAPDPPPPEGGHSARRSVSLPNQSETRHVLDELDKLRQPSSSRAVPDAGPAKHKRARRAAGPRAKPQPRQQPQPVLAPTTSAAPRQDARPPAGDVDTIGLVRALARRAHQLSGVPETAEVTVDDAVRRTKADAGALLVPDEGVWRVAAGVDLRPMEHRYELHPESWLVREIAVGQRGAIIEETDIARERLQGAPLGSCRHLLVAPVPHVDALLILARREDPAFTEHDLAELATLGAEAAPLLAAAMDTRALARALWEFRDEVDLPR